MSGTRNTSQGDNHGTQIQIGSVGGAVSIHQPEVRTVRILPQRETSVFQNRTEELALLDTLLERAESGEGGWLWSVVGGPAVGKTTLVLTWIIQNRHRFGHAQLAVACGGDPGPGRGRGVEQVCDEYFHAVGVDTDAPGFDTLEGKLSRFRQHTEGRPVVILLDDVRTAAQVEPFLADLPGTVVITTSREPVRGLGMRRPAAVQVGPLADEAITALFDDVLGPERRTAEPEAFTRLVDLCGGIPLFAGYAAGLLYDSADLSVAELVERMSKGGRIDFLEELSEAATRPAAVFDAPYQALDPDAARLYRALGTHPTRDFDTWLARAYFPDEPERGSKALQKLLNLTLVKTDWAGRYVMEHLTYEHAGWVARTRGSARERRLNQQRTRGYYLFGAVAADTAKRWKLGPLYGQASPYPLPDFTGAEPPSAAAPSENVEQQLDQWLERRRRVRERSARLRPRRDEWDPSPAVWFEANLEAILACVESTGRVWDGSRPEPGYAWQTAEATNAYFTGHGRIDERLTLLALAARDAEACGGADATARIRAQWGEALLGRGRLTEARQQLELSLAAARTEGTDPRGLGAALEWLGILERREGDREASERLLKESLPFLDHTRVRPLALHHMHLGDTALRDHDHEAAAERYEESLRLFGEHALREGPDHANEGKVLERLARLAEKDDPARSVTLLNTALDHFLAADRAYQVGKALERLGDLGEAPEQRWTTAAEVFDLVGAAGAAERVRGKLG
ncbi:hypothetical protein NE857_03865 [Nocardiopsis exhalans]|uniref:NB-ARC domain-containing protein n=1 Tax=Nocardiopsis exhalans TaxID=163604 RepID=A0ABY5DBP0_9ACTN|nr:tetratricopeptide repeat protein [Nocardiopsis exhalans]USY20800.1 hypothetical protein NE857_03865 [Nocardiopsis exhalans]